MNPKTTTNIFCITESTIYGYKALKTLCTCLSNEQQPSLAVVMNTGSQWDIVGLYDGHNEEHFNRAQKLVGSSNPELQAHIRIVWTEDEFNKLTAINI